MQTCTHTQTHTGTVVNILHVGTPPTKAMHQSPLCKEIWVVDSLGTRQNLLSPHEHIVRIGLFLDRGRRGREKRGRGKKREGEEREGEEREGEEEGGGREGGGRRGKGKRGKGKKREGEEREGGEEGGGREGGGRRGRGKRGRGKKREGEEEGGGMKGSGIFRSDFICIIGNRARSQTYNTKKRG